VLSLDILFIQTQYPTCLDWLEDVKAWYSWRNKDGVHCF